VAYGRNIILAGNPGTGKTHIAIGLGLKACLQGYKVYFTTVHGLLTQLRESHAQPTLRQMELRFEKYDLVICDEFGYISFDKQGAELLFNHLSLRAGRKATIITTNLGFDRWEEIFGDAVLTAALVDRLTHKAHLVNMNGESYRLRETREMMKKRKTENPGASTFGLNYWYTSLVTKWVSEWFQNLHGRHYFFLMCNLLLNFRLIQQLIS